MLVLSRKEDQRIFIGNDIVLTVVAIIGDKVRLGFEAPPNVIIHREEVVERINSGEPQRRETIEVQMQSTPEVSPQVIQ